MARDAADSANSRSSCGSILWNDGCGGGDGGALGTAISSVSSSTSTSSWEERISSAEVASSRPDKSASMSSWLFDTAGAGAAGGGTGVGGGAGAATFVAAATEAGIFDGGMSFITAGLAAGATAAGFSGFAGAGTAAGLAGFSATGGFASSSAMMRRIDARISSIEGSWTFAGCVISDSTSSTPFARVVPKSSMTELPVPDTQARILTAQSLTYSQSKHRANHCAVPPPQCTETSRTQRCWLSRESPRCPKKGYVMATNVCKQGSREEHWTFAHHLVANEPREYQRDTLPDV